MGNQSAHKVMENRFGPLDPAPEFRFYLEIDGLVEGAFVECSGMRAQREVIPHKEGGVNNFVHKLPGQVSYGDITLRKGVMFTGGFWDWFVQGILDGKVERRDFTIYHHSSYFNLPARWYDVKRAYPISWDASNLRADSNQLAMESLTLTFETIELRGWEVPALVAKLGLP